MAEDRASHTLTAGVRERVHGFDLDVCGIQVTDSAHSEQDSIPARAEQRDGRIPKPPSRQGVHVGRRSVLIHGGEVPRENRLDVGGHRIFHGNHELHGRSR